MGAWVGLGGHGRHGRHGRSWAHGRMGGVGRRMGGMGAAFIPWAAVRQDPTVRAFRFDPPVVRQDILVFRKGIEKTEPLRCLEEELVSQAQARERMSESKA